MSLILDLGKILDHLVIQVLVIGEPCQVSDENPPLSHLNMPITLIIY